MRWTALSVSKGEGARKGEGERERVERERDKAKLLLFAFLVDGTTAAFTAGVGMRCVLARVQVTIGCYL